MQRSLLLFENSIKSKETLRVYKYNLTKFLEWSQVKDHDSLLQVPDNHLQTMLEDYLFHLKKRLSPNSITPIFAALELFFTLNEKEYKFKKLRKMYPATVKKTGSTAYTTKDIQQMLLNTKKKRNRALVLFLASTGARIGVFENLQLKHVVEMTNGCKGVLFYEGSKEEYWGFLTPESSKALNQYWEERSKDGESLNQNSPVFRSDYQLGMLSVTPLSVDGAKGIIRRIISSGVDRTKAGKRYDKQADHGFRKRFNTILKLNSNVNSNIAEKLMGHKNGLDGVYLTPTREECFAEFQKAIIDLTIDDSERFEAKNQKLEAEKTEHEKEKMKMENMEKRIEELEYGPEARLGTITKD
ncbi:MAG: tyrosine-type recombinase/integrase, partial [Nitrosopumilaceae archaeon]